MTPTILFATDFSESSAHALPIASALAANAHATLLIVHVSELERQPVGELFDDAPELDAHPEPNPPLAARLEQVVPTEAGVPCEHRMPYGKPAEAIVQLAKNENVDMIVMGTHGYRGLSRALAGSVAEEVMREAPCPVIAVRLSKTLDGKKPVPVAAPARSAR